MKGVSAVDIRRIDNAAIRDYGISSLLLMENAGRIVSDVIARDYTCLSFHCIKSDKDCSNLPCVEIDKNWGRKLCRVLVFAGKGNNGGDGLVTARHLANRGFSVQIILLENPSDLKADPLSNFNIVRKMGIPLAVMTAASEEEFFGSCRNADLVVDAIFGVGIRSPVAGVFENAIHAINANKKPVISIDVPSGLDADTGQVQGVAVRATRTVTLTLPKAGFFEGVGSQYTGEIEVADIGIPKELLSQHR